MREIIKVIISFSVGLMFVALLLIGFAYFDNWVRTVDGDDFEITIPVPVPNFNKLLSR